MSKLQKLFDEQNARFNVEHGEPDYSIRIPENKYGYQIDLRHPLIEPYYERFIKYKNLSPRWPISDQDRQEFEKFMFQERDKGNLPYF